MVAASSLQRMSLQDLPQLLRSETSLTNVLGSSTGVLAVPEAARAFTIAGLSHLSDRHPFVVAVASGAEAERLTHDLRVWLGADKVDVFPAWETLPFERVSPSVETMGRRLQTMWHLRDPKRSPRVIVAPIRALLQRLGPHVTDVEPLVVRAGDRLDIDEAIERLVGLGYRREYQVEHRGEIAVRGSILDVFASTADVPVRVDLWGDDVDRLTEFSVADQRSTRDVESAEIFGARELLPTNDVRARAEQLIASDPWGRSQWERLSQGQLFDGMESWLPWLTSQEQVLTDLVGADAQVLLLEPRRMRDRAAELLAEEESLASTLAQTWGAAAEGKVFPQLHLRFDRLLERTKAAAWTITVAPEGPNVAALSPTAGSQAVAPM